MKPTPKTKNFRRFVAAMQQIMTVSKSEILERMEDARNERMSRRGERRLVAAERRLARASRIMRREANKIQRVRKLAAKTSIKISEIRWPSKERVERRRYLGRRRYWTKQLEICVNCYEENHLACDGGQCKCTCPMDLDRKKRTHAS